MQTREFRDKYNVAARWYDWGEALPEVLLVRRLRRRLLARAMGQVLEVAAGTGKNFPYYPPSTSLTAVDLSFEMLRRARKWARRLSQNAVFAVMDAEVLALRDRTFDTVLSSLTLCTFPDPIAAIREMMRVCRPDGRILLLEHGRSDRSWLARYQDRRAESHAPVLGCHWNREPLELAREAGLRVYGSARWLFGMFHTIEARLG